MEDEVKKLSDSAVHMKDKFDTSVMMLWKQK